MGVAMFATPKNRDTACVATVMYILMVDHLRVDFHIQTQAEQIFLLHKEDSDLRYGIEISPGNGLLSYSYPFFSSCHGKIGLPLATLGSVPPTSD